MNIDAAEIQKLKEEVSAAREEFDYAVLFHELWKPAAFDLDLRKRLGESYATQAFLVIRIALRREALLALNRMWDKTRGALRMADIGRAIINDEIIDALAVDRVRKFGLELLAEMKSDMSKRTKEASSLIEKYQTGDGVSLLNKLRAIRHEHLAHRDMQPTSALSATPTDEEFENFYQDNAKLIRILMSVVNATGYDPEETASKYKFYAGFFWDSVRGERTEGHPKYKASPS